MTDEPDNVIPIGGRKKPISFKEIPTGIRVKVHQAPHIEDLMRDATDADGWLDVPSLCSRFVVIVAGRTGYSQDALNECARVLNGQLLLYGYDVKVGFELTGPEAVRVNVFAQPRRI